MSESRARMEVSVSDGAGTTNCSMIYAVSCIVNSNRTSNG